MTDDPRILACMRVADMTKPKVPSRRSRCKQCGMQVWVARSSPAAKMIWCTQCAEDEMILQKAIEIAPPSAEQIADIKRRREQ